MTQGRDAENPAEIPVFGWKEMAFRIKGKIAEDPPLSGMLSAALFFSNFQVGGIGK